MKPVWIALPACAVLLALALWQTLPQTSAEFRAPAMVDSESRGALPRAQQSSQPLALVAPTPPETTNVAAPEEPSTPPPGEGPVPDKPEPEPVVPASFRGEVVLARKGARADGPSFAMIAKLEGSVPEKGSIIELCDEYGVFICQAKVLQHYHMDDKETLPVVEIGVQTIDESPSAPVGKGDRAVWPASKRLRTGYFSERFPNGNIACEGWYEEGVRTGEWTYWYEDGKLRARGSFKNDQPADTWYFWYDDGSNRAEWRQGEDQPWTVWRKDGRVDALATSEIPELYLEAEYNLELRRFTTADEIVDRIDELLAKLDDYNTRAEVEERVAALRARIKEERETKLNRDDFETRIGGDRSVREPLKRIETTPIPQLPPPVFPDSSLDFMYTPRKGRDPNRP